MSGIGAPARRDDLSWLIAAPVAALAWLFASRVVFTVPPVAISPQAVEPAGAWLSELAAWSLQPLTAWLPPESVLQVFSAAVMGLLAAYLLRRLLYNNWPVIDAAVLVAALAGNALVLNAIVSDQVAIPAMIAVAAAIPGLRRLEAVGDAQAEMSFGLILPLLFLAGPATAILILPLALLGALLDPLARQDRRAFVAMFLVALMPTLLVVVGIAAFAGWERIASVVSVYASFLTPELVSWEIARRFLLVFAATALPGIPILIAYCITGDDRRRQPLSAAFVWLLPVCLVGGAILFLWPIPPELPAFAFLGAFAAWLSVARVHPSLRRAAIAITAATAIASWAF